MIAVWGGPLATVAMSVKSTPSNGCHGRQVAPCALALAVSALACAGCAARARRSAWRLRPSRSRALGPARPGRSAGGVQFLQVLQGGTACECARCEGGPSGRRAGL